MTIMENTTMSEQFQNPIEKSPSWPATKEN
jgi:hypothetical protein